MASWGGASTCGTRGTIAIDTRPAAPRKAAGSLPPRMPRRRTKRGGERTPLAGDYDVIVCGASFAGLAVGARAARAPAACCCSTATRSASARRPPARRPPPGWRRSGSGSSIRQTFDKLVMHTPHSTVRFPLPWTFSTFDYPQLCELLDDQNDADFETAKVEGRGAGTGEAIEVRTDRGAVSAPLVVDALGWRRILGGTGFQPPDAPLSRGLEVHPHGSERRARDLGRPLDRPGRVRMELPGRRRGARRRRLVRPPLPRQGADGRPRPAAAARRRPLPGQLDPAPPAPRDRSRGVLRRRLRRDTACR